MSYLRGIVSRTRSSGPSESGQVLPLFALFLVVLLGMAALAIDISRAYSDLRFYRATTDASSLAGAQDLQTTGTRSVTATDQQRARGHALQSLEQRLNGLATGCGPTTADIIDCPIAGTPFLVSVKTPSPSCSTCDPDRSVQVTMRNPDYGLSFARLFGSDEWNVGTTSVSGLVYGSQYAVITLRPPKALGSTFDVKDIVLNGTGTTLTVRNGDIGSNSNMELNGTGAAVILDPGFKVFHYTAPPLWSGPPASQKISTLIRDPNYVMPSFTGAPTFNNSTSAAARSTADTDPTCQAEADKLDPAKYPFIATADPADIYCYNPGIYTSSNNNARIVHNANSDIVLLKPGAYYLRKGMAIGGHVIGGYEANDPGVVLAFDECGNTCNFDGTNALTISLNAGDQFPPGSGGATASAAIDWAGNPVLTSGPSSPTPPLIITLYVVKDPGCYVPTSAPFIEPSSCNNPNSHKTLNMAGGGSLALIGVQYAPSDNIKISGGSSGDGEVGQIIAWTITYDGGTRINQHYPGATGNGILRIDAACSAPSEPCSP
jgi:hypothetical protein